MAWREALRGIGRDLAEINHIFRLKRELEHDQQLGPRGLYLKQEWRLRAVLHHAVRNSPFYRERFRGLDVERCPLKELPVLTKREMMDHYDELVTDERLNLRDLRGFLDDPATAGTLFKDEFVILSSSGTSGEKGVMAYHWREFDHAYAAAMARGNSLGASWRDVLRYGLGERLRVANVMLTHSHSASFVTAYRLSPDPANPIMANRFYSVFMPLEELCRELEQLRPHILQAYSSVLDLLARAKLDGRLRLDDPQPTVVALSEPLAEGTRQLCREAFGGEVINTYGACESIILARGCPRHAGMHMNADLVIMENVDADHRPVPHGTPGERLLVTNLYTRYQPLIRYELHDRLTFASVPAVCPNRLPLIAAVEGRTERHLLIPGKDGSPEAVHPYLFLLPVLSNPGIREFQVEQTSLDTIIFRVVPEDAAWTTETARRVMEQTLAENGFGGRLTVLPEITAVIPRDPVSGKIIQVVSRVGGEGMNVPGGNSFS